MRRWLTDAGVAGVVLIAAQIAIAAGHEQGSTPRDWFAYLLGLTMAAPVLLRRWHPVAGLGIVTVALMLFYVLGYPGFPPAVVLAVPLYDVAQASTRALANARAFRELLHGVFAAIADGRSPDDGDLARLARAYARAASSARITGTDGRFTLTWPPDGSLEPLLHCVADSAVKLLEHGPLDRVGACPSCGWLFLDTSKNGRRRWCSMATCGARDKARRHYRATISRPARR